MYKSTLNYARLREIISEANSATEEKKVILRDELQKLLAAKYEIAKDKGVLQYHFILSDNESFLRMHKPAKFGDDLTDVRADIKYTNATQKPVRVFARGKTAHGFRNTFPLFDKAGKHIGAMEISFSSDSFQAYMNDIGHIHTHFLVLKDVFETKSWERDDLVLKYVQSAESPDYMITIKGIHSIEKCIDENRVRLVPVRQEIDSKILLGKKFSSYVEHYDHVDMFSFIPIKNLKDKTVAWVASYEKSPFILSTLKDMLIVRLIGLLFSSLLIYFILQLIRSKKSIELLHERMELAFKGNKDGIWDWNLLDNSIYFSPRWKEMLGYSDSELPNEFSTLEKYIHPDDLKEAQASIKENIDGETEYYEGVHRLKHKDGHWVWIRDRGKTLYDSSGKAIRMLGTHTDITYEHKTQEELQKFQAILENAPISIVITDLDGAIEYVNPWFTKITGYTLKEAVGQNPRILKTEYHSSEEYDKLWSDITHDKAWSGIFENQKKNGEHYWESAIISPVHNAKGEVINYLGIKEEISKEVYLKQQLEEKEEIMIAQSRHAAMGEMISMIAHQWRQPITVISMVANNLLADVEFDEVEAQSVQKSAKKVLLQTHHLSKTIDDFKNFFRPNKKLEIMLINDVIEENLGIIGKSLENNNIAVEKEYAVKTPIATYSRELLQVLINIFKNAKEALVENRVKDPVIMVRTHEDAQYVYISICNNGKGIDPEIVAKIYDPYFSTKDEKVGTGLGLYMSKTIIEKHLNGTIKAQNIKEGGVCFEISLPKQRVSKK